MQIVRTVLWVLLLMALMVFSFFNWKPVEVTIWDNLILETKVPALVIVSFLLGMIPTWLLHRGTKWRLSRRIKTLENAVKATATSPDTAPTTASAAASTEDKTPLSATTSGETKTWP